MIRRSLALLPLAGALLAACSVLPDRPAVDQRRYPLAPARPPGGRRGAARRSLLVRLMRWAPGLDARGLRSLTAEGNETSDYYNEWTAPPSDLAEEALRRWLTEARLFSAILTPGTRATADLILEAELNQLRAEPSLGRARAGIAGVLLSDGGAGTRLLTQFAIEAEAPLAAATPEAGAAAMTAALANALGQLEARLAPFA
ncbi:ABC-type transport auxiliary lipoprotein family protein [Plastoroseomonas arctica]|uniref:ABC-type transport auxiliary lipoprotein component domain-containing protein n=1 Tax=Plastoroseomonas arctica TaxID=1509237 RepID=A0AAF1KN87_9PROT|nr:ABC-type transport auxiliary lipoprotein family protein [Plastoroseomonas arctica]MBR0654253.1 hypothetical protein [Plastoroseomonas arctica]